MLLTYKYRIKDSTSNKYLRILANKVNYIWNYINELNVKSYVNFKQGQSQKFLSSFEINNLLSGAFNYINLPARTIQHISESYVSNRRIAKKNYLSWRTSKRSLGWIPFKNKGFRFSNSDSHVIFQKKIFKIYKDRTLPNDAVITNGSFNQDSRGRWYVNITFETAPAVSHSNPGSSVGIDLGVKDAMTLSDGTSVSQVNLTKKYEDKLALAQRARKKKLVKSIHAKIKNSRKDFYHKESTQIAKRFASIYVGNVKSQDIIDKDIKPLIKGVYDASWYFLKTLLEYKAIKLGGNFKEVDEAYSTQTCSVCDERTGPKGLSGLRVREWGCKCGAFHKRDVNAAINILRSGHGTPVGNSVI
jgi:putative transposase